MSASGKFTVMIEKNALLHKMFFNKLKSIQYANATRNDKIR